MVPPRALPRIDFAKGVPAAHATLVAVPTILTEPSEVDELLEDLEIRYLSNRDPSIHFALITDLRDAATEQTPADAPLIRRAIDGITALNAKYPPADNTADKTADSPRGGGGFFPVSYTHLDVYKRQELETAEQSGFRIAHTGFSLVHRMRRSVSKTLLLRQ